MIKANHFGAAAVAAAATADADAVAAWAAWEDGACALCGADLEVYTDAPEGSACDGDAVRCGEGHTGSVSGDEGGRGW
jgi:hypothetical protein